MISAPVPSPAGTDAGKAPLVAARKSLDSAITAMRTVGRLPDPLTGDRLAPLTSGSLKHVLQTLRAVGLIDRRTGSPSTALHAVVSKEDNHVLSEKILGYLPTIVGAIERKEPPGLIDAMFLDLSGTPSSQLRCKRLILSFLSDENFDIRPYADEPSITNIGTVHKGASSNPRRGAGSTSTEGSLTENQVLLRSLEAALTRDSLTTADWIWEHLKRT
jgi:hypothetical protein